MLQISKLIVLIMLLTSCTPTGTNQENYDALTDESIKRAEYERIVDSINFCITDLKHGDQPISDDLITEELLNESSRVYCSDYTTTLEHAFVRYCRYLIYAEKNRSNVQSCHCDLIEKQKVIRAQLKEDCEQLKDAFDSNNQAIVAHLGDDFKDDCASLDNLPDAKSEYVCD